MSKLLIKILSICALVVLLPLVVVGASLSVTEAVGCSLTVAINGNEGSATKEGKNPLTSNVLIKVDGKVQEGTTIKVAKYSEVTVIYSGVGYNFKGWYEGEYYEDIQTEKQPEYKLAEYTFELTHDTTLTAVRDIKTYRITYTGNYDNGDPIETVVEPVVEYNQALRQLDAKAGGYFSGWREVNSLGQEIGETVSYANFDSAEVTLSAKWNETMTVTYVCHDGQEFEARVNKYALPDTTNSNVKVGDGYKFLGWKDSNGARVEKISEFDSNGITLYIDETPIIYNIKVNNGNSQVAGTYDVKTGFTQNIKTLENPGYTIETYTYNGNTYSSLDELATAIVNADVADPETTEFEVTVNWKLTQVKLNVKFHKNAAQTSTITYNDATKEFSDYTVTRDGYKFIGLKINGSDTLYNYDAQTKKYNSDLGAAIMAKGTETVDVTAVWESEYGSYNFLVKAIYYDEYDDSECNHSINGKKPDNTRDWNLVQFTDETPDLGAEAKDLNDNDVYADYILGNSVTNDTGEEVTFTGDVKITLGTDDVIEFTIDEVSPTLTYYKVLVMLEEQYPEALLTTKNITIAFVFNA